MFAVHFELGARTEPHVHHAGQVLSVTEGEGIVADGDGPAWQSSPAMLRAG